MAIRIDRAMVENPERSTLALSRNRCPMGGYCSPVKSEAWCRAGHTWAFCVLGAVNRMACLMVPAAASSYRTKPGKMGKPAASADVQPSGGRALEDKSKTAPDPACQLMPDARGLASNSS